MQENLAASKLACIVFFCSSAQYFYHTWDAYHWTVYEQISDYEHIMTDYAYERTSKVRREILENWVFLV